jgi:hypothetical protein
MAAPVATTPIPEGEVTMRNILITLGLALMLLTTLGQAQTSADQPSSNQTSADQPSSLLPLTVESAEAAQVTEPGLSTNGNQLPPVVTAYCLYRSYGYGVFRCNWGVINANSRVFAAISEYGTGPTNRFLGAAHMTVHNIIPHNGYVEVLVDTGWSSPINLRLDLSVDQ